LVRHISYLLRLVSEIKRPACRPPGPPPGDAGIHPCVWRWGWIPRRGPRGQVHFPTAGRGTWLRAWWNPTAAMSCRH